MESAQGPLHDLRVLDLAGESGVYCGKLLGDLGADVVKVEPPGGVAMRRIGPFYRAVDHPDRSLFFWHYNTSKRSIVLDLHRATDRERLADLADAADVMVETGKPGGLDALGLGYTALAARNPRLTVVSITPFGQHGPRRFDATSDLVAQAVGGMVSVNGFPDDPPLQGCGLQAYHSASVYGAIGALLALVSRHITGRGQWVDVSLQDSSAACVEHATSLFHTEGRAPTRLGSLHWTGHFRIGRGADGDVLLCTLCDWTTLVEWMRADAAAEDLIDPRWDEVKYRQEHCEHVFEVLDRWVSRYPVADLVAAAQLRRIPCGAVRAPDALRDDPQLRSRGFFASVRHPEIDATLAYPGAPYVFSRTPWRIRCRAPRIGEHTSEVFRDWVRASTIDSKLALQVAPEASGCPPASTAALAGLRVLDFTWMVAGPLATRILADQGAQVIKVERRDTLDVEDRRQGLTGSLNRGKHSIVIDMGNAAGVTLAQRLAAASDVVIDNFSARVMRNWGLDDATLHQLNPGLIVVHMSGFGHSGPAQDFVSYGPTLQAMSGHTWLMRGHDGRPAGWGFSYSDMAAGASAALGVLAALRHRQRTGEGQSIDLSQYENLCALLGPGLLALLQGRTLETPGNRSQELLGAPHGIFRCADRPGDGPARDRWCAIAVFGDEQWHRFRAVLGDPAWMRDARFATRGGRLELAALLEGHIEQWTRERSAEMVAEQLQAAGIAAGVVADAEDLCQRDAHLRARGYWVCVVTPEGREIELAGVPFQLSETPRAVMLPGPLLGEHTDEILEGILGMGAHDIATLRTANVIA